MVNTSTGKVLIVSDNSWTYYNFEHMISVPITFDSAAYIKPMQRMKTLVEPGLIIPGHDAKFFKKFTNVKDGIVRTR